MSGYIGTQPIPRASRVLTQGALSTDAQTISVPGGYNPGNIFVYLDGARLRSSDFDDNSGTTVDLLEIFPTGTEYIVEEIRSFEIPNHYTKTEIQNASFDFNNMPTVGGDPIVESGSNSDGEWTRLSTGDLFCLMDIFPDYAFSGNQTFTAPQTSLVSFAACLSTSGVAANLNNRRAQGACYVAGNTSDVVLDAFADGASVYQSSILAVGRWK